MERGSIFAAAFDGRQGDRRVFEIGVFGCFLRKAEHLKKKLRKALVAEKIPTTFAPPYEGLVIEEKGSLGVQNKF